MTKLTKILFIKVLLISLPIIYFGCDDSGVVIHSPSAGFSQGGLLPLGAEENATYELFVSFGSGTDNNLNTYCSMGKFNIAPTLQVVDLSGAPVNFKFNFTPDMTKAVDAIITIEPKPDNDTLPNGPVIMGGIKTIVSNVYVFNFSTQYSNAFGTIASQFLTDSAKFILASPTAGIPSSLYTRGVWFTTDSTGNNPGISCASIPDSLGWIYHAYVVDSRDTVNGIYDIGRFQNPGGGDDFNSCYSIGGASWIKPGQDWLQANCPGAGLHDIDGTAPYSLNNGSYNLLITIEPKSRTATTPFFLRMFYGNIPAMLGFNIVTILNNVSASHMPGGDITISSNNSN